MTAPAIAVPGSVQRETQSTFVDTELSQQQQQQQEIANLAYVLWQQRGGIDGSAEQDWLEAERRVQNQTVSLQTGR